MTAILAAACCCDRDEPPTPISCSTALRYCFGNQVKFKFASTLTVTTFQIGDNGLPCINAPLEEYYQTAKFNAQGPIIDGQESVVISVKGSTTQRRTVSFLGPYPPGSPCPSVTPCTFQEQVADWTGEGLFGCSVNPDCPIPPGINQFNPAFQIFAILNSTPAALRFEYLPDCCVPGISCIENSTGNIGGILRACFLAGCNYPIRCPAYTATFNCGSVQGPGQLEGGAWSACSFNDAYYTPSGFVAVSQTGMIGAF